MNTNADTQIKRGWKRGYKYWFSGDNNVREWSTQRPDAEMNTKTDTQIKRGWKRAVGNKRPKAERQSRATDLYHEMERRAAERGVTLDEWRRATK